MSSGSSRSSKMLNNSTRETSGTCSLEFVNENDMSTSRQEFAKLMPSLDGSLFRGDCGRICIVGGSKSETGPPFFAGLAALNCGADVVTVITTCSAAIPVKCYSSAMTVVPYLPEKGNIQTDDFMTLVWPWVKSTHALCIGPGLGDDEVTQSAVIKLIDKARISGIAIVLNSGAIPLVNKEFDLLSRDLPKSPVVIIMTEVEFSRVWDVLHKVGVMSFRLDSWKAKPCRVGSLYDYPWAEEFFFQNYNKATPIHQTAHVAAALGPNVVMVRMGLMDITVNSEKCFVFGGPKLRIRCRGQGDILAGLVAVYLSWLKLKNVSHDPMVAVGSADVVMRLAALDAVDCYKRVALATNIAKAIPGVMLNLSRRVSRYEPYAEISSESSKNND